MPVQLDLIFRPTTSSRFEVLRGPQGTLYAAGSEIGVIKYVFQAAERDGLSGGACRGPTVVRTIHGASKMGEVGPGHAEHPSRRGSPRSPRPMPTIAIHFRVTSTTSIPGPKALTFCASTVDELPCFGSRPSLFP